MTRTLTIILGTLAASAVVAMGAAYAFVNSGIYDVSATTPDSGLVYWATHQTMEHSVARRLGANIVPADLDTPANGAAGGAIYLANCAVCHGGPGLAPTAISQGLNPQPPDLFGATREPDPAENFQFIKHGVKMTGMPAFAPTKSDEEIWSLVAFLNVAPGITAEDSPGDRPDSDDTGRGRALGARFGEPRDERWLRTGRAVLAQQRTVMVEVGAVELGKIDHRRSRGRSPGPSGSSTIRSRATLAAPG